MTIYILYLDSILTNQTPNLITTVKSLSSNNHCDTSVESVAVSEVDNLDLIHGVVMTVIITGKGLYCDIKIVIAKF